MILILAPHVDDAVIGCWSILKSRNKDVRVAYVFPTELNRLEEGRLAAKELDFEVRFLAARTNNLMEVLDRETSDNITEVWAPDPHWETHPQHKQVGQTAKDLCQGWTSFGTYSTNMNVPYLQTLKRDDSLAKKQRMDYLFPSQSNMWKCDHRYFLFEGRALWNPAT